MHILYKYDNSDANHNEFVCKFIINAMCDVIDYKCIYSYKLSLAHNYKGNPFLEMAIV